MPTAEAVSLGRDAQATVGVGQAAVYGGDLRSTEGREEDSRPGFLAEGVIVNPESAEANALGADCRVRDHFGDADASGQIYADPAERGAFQPRLDALGESADPFRVAPENYGTGEIGKFAFAIPLISNVVPVALSIRRSVSSLRQDSMLDLAEALIDAGALKQSDWNGRSIESSIDAGIKRWIDRDLDGRKLTRVFGNLRFEFGTDIASVTDLANMTAWHHELGGSDKKPLGFMALSVTGERPIAMNVKDRVLELEEVFGPKLHLGYRLLHLIGISSRWSCNGLSFLDGYEMAHAATLRLSPEDASDPESTEFSLMRFFKSVPKAACTHYFAPNMVQLAEAEVAKDKRKRKYSALLCRIDKLSNLMIEYVKDQGVADQSTMLHLGRSMPWYMTWSDEPNEMSRLVDDWYFTAENSVRGEDIRVRYPFCWAHGFQLGHQGQVPRGMQKACGAAAKGKEVFCCEAHRIAAAEGFEVGAVGSVAASVKAVRQVMALLVEMEAILGWLAQETYPGSCLATPPETGREELRRDVERK